VDGPGSSEELRRSKFSSLKVKEKSSSSVIGASSGCHVLDRGLLPYVFDDAPGASPFARLDDICLGRGFNLTRPAGFRPDLASRVRSRLPAGGKRIRTLGPARSPASKHLLWAAHQGCGGVPGRLRSHRE
jgi:hypothetical protein